MRAPTPIETIPSLPGVYLFKSKDGEVLYVGKAKDLRRRVNSYFQSAQADQAKIQHIRVHCSSIGYVVTKSEIDALLLEADLIRKYRPHCNVLLKDGDPFIYLAFVMRDGVSRFQVVRVKKRDGIYFGPFVCRRDARAVHDFLVRTFMLFTCGKKIENGCLDYHLGRCAGSCKSDFDKAAYEQRVRMAQAVLAGNHKAFLADIDAQIKGHSQRMEFEQAQRLHLLGQRFAQIFEVIETKFSEVKYAPEVFRTVAPQLVRACDYEQASMQLQELLVLEQIPVKIDCFDVSHFQSNCIVGSCVRFTRGEPDHTAVRRFRIKTIVRQDDYAALRELVRRRYKDLDALPDVVLIDGGKGQLGAVFGLLPSHVACVSLAKKEELLFAPHHPDGVHLTPHTPAGKLLIALRDYAHHFAVSYHRKRRLLTLLDSPK